MDDINPRIDEETGDAVCAKWCPQATEYLPQDVLFWCEIRQCGMAPGELCPVHARRVAQERDLLRVECDIWRDKIDSEWKKLNLADAWIKQSLPPSTSVALSVLRGLGVYACDECGGVGCEFCDGRGWLMTESDGGA